MIIDKRSKERDDAWEEYRPKLKKQKKELIKLAKEYQPYDFGYIDNIVFQLIKMTYEWYSNKNLLTQDTTWKYSAYPEGIKALTRCKEIVNILQNDYAYIDEYDLRKELYELIAEFGVCWWD